MAEATAAAPQDFKLATLCALVPNYDGRKMSLWLTIEFTAGRLSIRGVEGPRRNGDCTGGCGQTGISPDAEPAPGYTAEMLDRLRQIWYAWHLNDMRAYTAEMEALGWRELAANPVIRREYADRSPDRPNAEKAAQAALKAGQTFTPTPDQIAAVNRPLFLELYHRPGEPEPTPPAGYELRSAETKTLGWVKPSEHPDGLLGRRVRPDDADGYGTKWYRAEVPGDVLEFLRSLPDHSDRYPWTL